jgi:outer membrane protein assembly factor BamB
MKINKILIIILMSLWSVHMLAQEIVQWRGPNRDGIYPETGLMDVWPEEGPPMLWHYDDLGPGHASATVTSDRIYTSGTIEGMGHVFCFDHQGTLLWKAPYGKEWMDSYAGSRTTPLYVEEKLYMLSAFGLLSCLDANDGSKLWETDLFTDYDGRNNKWGITENLLVDGNTLFCTPGGVENNVIALDRNTGKLIWSSPGKGEVSAYCSPLLVTLPERKLVVTQTASSILGIDASDGTLLWSHPWPNKYSVHANTPYYKDGSLYCMSGYGKGGIKLKLSHDGSVKQALWTNPEPDNRMGGFVVWNDVIYGADDRAATWFGIDWNSGEDLFVAEEMLGKGNVIFADGHLYCYSDRGEVALIKPTASGMEKISGFKVPYGSEQHWAHLVIDDQKLYVRHGNSLMVYDIRQQ